MNKNGIAKMLRNHGNLSSIADELLRNENTLDMQSDHVSELQAEIDKMQVKIDKMKEEYTDLKSDVCMYIKAIDQLKPFTGNLWPQNETTKEMKNVLDRFVSNKKASPYERRS